MGVMRHFHNSEIRKADHNPITGVMRAWFVGAGGPFDFHDVPEPLFESLCSSLQRDEFFTLFIKGKFSEGP